MDSQQWASIMRCVRIGSEHVDFLNLSKDSSAKSLGQKIDRGGVLLPPMAPPCGSSSRDRDKPSL